MKTDFDFQPTLAGDRVTVRPIVPADWERMFAAAADPRIWAGHPARDRYREPVFRRFFDDAISSGSAFAIVDHQRGNIIGSSRYQGYDPGASEIEVGWTFLSCDYWGGSFNAEIKQLMLDHAFRFVATVVFWVGESNVRSRRAMEKIGGVLRDGVHYRALSGDRPNVVYEIRKERWRTGKGCKDCSLQPGSRTA